MANWFAIAVGANTGQTALASAQDGASALHQATLSIDRHESDKFHREVSTQDKIQLNSEEVVTGSHAGQMNSDSGAISVLANAVTN